MRHTGSLSEPPSCTAARPASSSAAETRSGRSKCVESEGNDRSSAETKFGTSSEDVLHALEDVAIVLVRERMRRGLFGRQQLRELFEDVSLFFRQLLRNVGVQRDAEVALAAARYVGQAL